MRRLPLRAAMAGLAALTALAVLVGAFGAPARAKSLEFGARDLARITEICVLILDLDPAVAAAGLDATVLQSEMEGALREAGLRIVGVRDYAYAMYVGSALPPALVVDIHTLSDGRGGFVVNVEVEVWESVILALDDGAGVPQAATWRAPAVLSTVTREQVPGIVDMVREMVRRFLKARAGE